MPARRQISEKQLEILLDFAEANTDITVGRGTRGPHASLSVQRAWETIATKLNSEAGVTKTGEQWRRYWIELKAKTKTKGADIRRTAPKTVVESNKLLPLNEFEHRILQLIGRSPSPSTSMFQSQPSPIPTTSKATDSTYHQRSPSCSSFEIEYLEDEKFPIVSSLPQPTSQTIPPDPLLSPKPLLPPAPSSQPSLRRRRRPLRIIRNRAFPRWVRQLEERRVRNEERHTRALEALQATLDRRLGNIENILWEIRIKKIYDGNK